MTNGLPIIPANRKGGKFKMTKTQEISLAKGHIPVGQRYKAPNYRNIRGYWCSDKSSSSLIG